MSAIQSGKINALETLRGAAALCVAVYHLRLGYFDNQFFAHAGIMVDFFFILSGFVIALNYRSRLASVADITAFQTKRFFRLYPLHLITLLAFVVIEIIASPPHGFENDLGSLVANLFLVHNFTEPGLTWNYVSWSISAEFYTYLLFAIVVFFARSERTLLIVSTLLCAVCWTLLLINNRGIIAFEFHTGPLRCIFNFFLGAILVSLFDRMKHRSVIRSSVPSLALVLLTILGITFFGVSGNLFRVFLPFLFALTILVGSLTDPAEARFAALLNHRHLVYTGTISYGIYMIHPFVWWVLQGSAGQVVQQSDLIATGFVIFGLALVLGVSHLSYKHIEAPAARYGARLGWFSNLKQQKAT